MKQLNREKDIMSSLIYVLSFALIVISITKFILGDYDFIFCSINILAALIFIAIFEYNDTFPFSRFSIGVIFSLALILVFVYFIELLDIFSIETFIFFSIDGLFKWGDSHNKKIDKIQSKINKVLNT